MCGRGGRGEKGDQINCKRISDCEHILIKIAHMARQAGQDTDTDSDSPESCGYLSRKQSHDSCSIRLYNGDAQVVPRHGRRYRICQRRSHRIGKPDECEYFDISLQIEMTRHSSGPCKYIYILPVKPMKIAELQLECDKLGKARPPREYI